MTRHGCIRCGLSVLAVTGLLAVGGCPPWSNSNNPPANGEVGLQRFTSGDELLSFFKDQAMAKFGRSNDYSGGLFDFLAAPSATQDTGGAAPQPGATGAGGADNQSTGEGEPFSTTNLQETGVDESDVFKSDGKYFYMARGKTLRIIQATPPAEMSEVGHIDLDTSVSELYLLDKKAIVLGQKYSSTGGGYPGSVDLMIWPPYREASSVVVYEVDITDPTAPTKARQIEVDGSLVSSRLTGGRLFLVLTIVPPLPENPDPVSISLLTLDQVLPKAQVAGAAENMMSWQDFYRPGTGNGYYLTGVVTLDAGNIETIVGSTAVMASASTIYASTDALYLAADEFDSQGNGEITALHKFTFDAQTGAQYVGSGSVPGRLLNQFSLGENEGYLRVATHNEYYGGVFMGTGTAGGATAPVSNGGSTGLGSQQSSAVYVLGAADSKLNVVGKVEGIAPGELFHSARFLGNHGFLVTYRKTDPLFVLDLTSPTDPQVVGELKIPGFSDYLHPLGDTHLIGVGKFSVASETGGFDWYQGVQVSLFDVSDWSNPKVVQQLTFGGRGSQSDVEQTHKAFTFLAESGLLALPVELTSQNTIPWDYGDPVFDGVIALQVDPATGFTELGRLPSVNDVSSGFSEWRRAAFIGDALYALTPAGVRAGILPGLAETHTLTLPAEAP